MAAPASQPVGAAGDARADEGAQRMQYEESVRFFNTFLLGNRDDWVKRINAQRSNGKYRIPIQLSEIDSMEQGLSRRVLEDPVKYLVPWEEALLSFLKDVNEKGVRELKQPLKLDITGGFGQNHVTPRGMNCNTLQNLMCVEGVVIKAGVASPKLLQSMHVRADGEETHVETRDHRDATSFVNQPLAGAMPSHDREGNALEVEIGLSVYKDSQKFSVQESPENAPPGQLPRSIEVICEGDLCETTKPGDRVQVVGVYKSFPPPTTDFTTGVFPARLIATNITPMQEITNSAFIPQDVTNIKQVAARPDAFELLGRSFAPAICGHANPKKGMLLQMIGGTEKNLANGTHLRGDINVLLVGDPSCGKSQMLRFVMNTAPLAVSTTGRGSSGVGLTAALTREAGSRDFNIEAGAMVLADRGFICIDEFDKMGLNDRVMIHEAMEQQCVTIAKAGLHMTLNARCSVVAAANPIYGSFDPSLDLAKNIGMPDSLLSRFDLIFVVRDLTNEDIDRKIADQVVWQASQVNAHESRRGVEQVHSSVLQRRAEQDAARSQEPTAIFEKKTVGPDGQETPDVLTVDFLRKYIKYCRRLTPVLNEEAQIEVTEKYCDMRMRFQSGMADSSNPDSNKKPRLAVTTRTLEALIRLATAHAKLKLQKDEVTPEDVRQAYKLMMAAREEDVPQAPQENDGGDDEPADDGDDGTGPAPGASRGQKRSREAAGPGLEQEAITVQRLKVLTTVVADVFNRQRTQEMNRAELMEGVNAGILQGEMAFDVEEFEAGLAVMESKNQIFVSDESVFLVS